MPKTDIEDMVEIAISDAVDPGTFDHGTNVDAVISDMVANVVAAIAAAGMTYDHGVTAGFNEAVCEVRRGEIDPQTYTPKT